MSTIFITGASGGIGTATARLFQARGWNVVATMRSPEEGRHLAGLDNVLVTTLDVTDPTIDPRRRGGRHRRFRIDRRARQQRRLRVYASMEAIPDTAIQDVFTVNVFGYLYTVKHCCRTFVNVAMV